ncbi:isochorismatase family cysteine hydrolase [Peribacillus simplex]|uniref:Isochorismatase family cysteine hydrolase n=1 Tax=Peribacillus simplex TaxID=1478 RepID=A0AAW7IK34_9BACI|nr:isochorismatase family cysteine hydrolase [Peribacillus simplex]AMM93004.1 isochorismatase [Peribacillus simplex]MDM5294833.1 isochorismatase family cysteine hydrolase [Peribacillus simplex]MDM5453789.1 isochorismatase family cysteine hydrolase [Peribacillus simplex]
MDKKALINIDYTYDFVADGGSLTCGKPGQDIEKALVRITKEFIKQGGYTVFAIDLHENGDRLHPESNLFPPHNISGTMGRDLYGTLKEEYETNKNQKNVHYIDKTRYSAFAGTDLDIRLRERHITDVYLVGVCTDICILHTAIDAYNLGYNIFIYENAVASFNDAGHHWALGHFKGSLGATIL